MGSSSPLSAEQIESFKTHGFLVLKNLFNENDIDIWRKQIWRTLDSSSETPETWPRERSGLDGYEYDPPESTFGLHPKLTAVADQLGGGEFVLGDGIPIIRWPEPSKSWELPRSGHIDAYGGRWLPFMFGATMYLYDVERGGGSFFFWPDSHYVAHRYFLEHPDEIAGSFRRHSRPIFSDIAPGSSREFTGKAGDVLLWHSYLCHSGSVNVHPSPRFAVVVRYAHRLKEDPAFKLEVPEDLWKYWAI